MPDLLAAHFLVCRSTRLFNGGCAGSDPGFFCYDTGTSLAGARRPQSRPVPFALAHVAPEFSHQCCRENSCSKTRRRCGIHFLGRLDGGGAIGIIDLGSGARITAGGAPLRPSLGHDGGGTSASTPP